MLSNVRFSRGFRTRLSRTAIFIWFLAITLSSCRSASLRMQDTIPDTEEVTMRCLWEERGDDRFSAIASSRDGQIYLLARNTWRIVVFEEGRGEASGIDLGPGRYLLAGGAIQGMVLIDAARRQLIRYDQQGREILRSGYGDFEASALWMASSDEYYFLDGAAGRIYIKNQLLSDIRSWNLKGTGKPQSLASSPLEGLVVVSYPDQERLDTYSLLGTLVDSRSYSVGFGSQTIAFDSFGRLWALGRQGIISVFQYSHGRWVEKASLSLPSARAISIAPREGMIALGEEKIFHLVIP